MAKSLEPIPKQIRRSARIHDAKTRERSSSSPQSDITGVGPASLILITNNTEILDHLAKVSKRPRFRRPRQRKSCRLLCLPGELLNAIYRAAIVEHEPIQITADGPGQPTLLRVCKRIRNETRHIYYTENEFTVVINNYDGAALGAFTRLHTCFSLDGTFKMRMLGQAHWPNLLLWLEAIYWGSRLIPEWEVNEHPDDKVVAGMITIVEELRYHGWPKVKTVLEAAQSAVVAKHRCWS